MNVAGASIFNAKSMSRRDQRSGCAIWASGVVRWGDRLFFLAFDWQVTVKSYNLSNNLAEHVPAKAKSIKKQQVMWPHLPSIFFFFFYCYWQQQTKVSIPVKVPSIQVLQSWHKFKKETLKCWLRKKSLLCNLYDMSEKHVYCITVHPC